MFTDAFAANTCSIYSHLPGLKNQCRQFFIAISDVTLAEPPFDLHNRFPDLLQDSIGK